jgi:molybdopterin/thiamine biosynthesis adenylyltransferase
MNDAVFYRRIRAILSPEKLRRKKAVVVGLGSGGCRVAAELARIGVQLVLVERPGELLLEHNIVRHLLGYRSLGRPKLHEMVRYLHNVNPSVPLESWELDVLEDAESFREKVLAAAPHLIAVCTDSEQSKQAVNLVALRAGIPQTGGGVYDGGVGGEVYLVRPGGACYGCLAAQLQRHEPKNMRRPTGLDYSQPDLEELRSTCALNMDIQQIALLQSRFALHLLLEGSPDLLGLPESVNVCVFANRIVPGTFARPWHAEFYSVPRAPECLLCGAPGAGVDEEAARIRASLGMPG